MSTTALFIIHKTKPGQRDAVKEIWVRHMAPAIQANPEHLAYFYNFDNNDSDSICAYQQYQSEQAAKDFLNHPNYQQYLVESRDLLEHEPRIISLTPQWIKAV